MGAQRTSFGKLQRDRAKKAKAAAKRERRQERETENEDVVDDDAPETVETDADGEGELSAAELLERIEAIHQRFDAGTISYEDFEEKKAELLARLPID